MVKRRPRIKKAATETAAVRRDELLRRAVNDVGAVVGVPETQRGHHAVAIVPTAVDGAARPIERTLRKLTRVERLLRSGAITARHAEAIDRYVEAADIAHAGTVRVAAYGEGGGSSPTGAAAAAHQRLLDRVGASHWLDDARSALPARHVVPFERIVLDNHPIGLVGASLWPGASVGAVSGAIRDLVRTCADLLVAHYRLAQPDDQRAHLLQTMQRLDAAVRAREAPAATPVSDAIAVALQRAPPHDALYVCPDVLRDLMREQALTTPPVEWQGVQVVLVEHWQFGWMVVPKPIDGR